MSSCNHNAILASHDGCKSICTTHQRNALVIGCFISRIARFDGAGVDDHVSALHLALAADVDDHGIDPPGSRTRNVGIAVDEIALRIVGSARERVSVLSFVMEGVHPHDIGTVLDNEGVAIRTGQHCAQPVMDRYGIVSTARASFAIYNTQEEIHTLVAALHKARTLLS